MSNHPMFHLASTHLLLTGNDPNLNLPGSN